MRSSRFAVAVHILTLLELSGGEPVTSEWIGASVGTNPAVIRRILCMLSRAGLTTSQPGKGGGARQARPAAGMTLLEVYRAVGGGDPLGLRHEHPDPGCAVGRHVEGLLAAATGLAQRALEAELARRTVAEVVRVVAGVEGSDRPAH